ncbi:MAG TPA: hypothetical protein VJB35_01055 [Candidatus Nanoarchaeia archaeon]|nr:hypothetical protein [Candidatus Nanoarchaeia archaeon]
MIKKVTNHLKNNFKIYLVVLIFFLSLILFITLSYAKYSILETKIIKTSVIIGDTPGFDLNSTTLTLGRIDNYTSMGRSFTIKNDYNFPIKIYFDPRGNISKLLIFEQNSNIGINETKTFYISANNNINASYGEYSGEIIVIIKRDF